MVDRGHGDVLTVLVTAAFAVLVGTGYLAAALGGSRPWPVRRALAFGAGLLCVVVACTGPLPRAAEHSGVAHASAHVLLGMLGPLLLVLGAPVSLALRTLPVAHARRLSHLLARRPVRLLTEPVVAAALSVGGLYVLYLTPLHGLSERQPAVHLLVHVHLLAAGYLLAAVLVGPDPLPHRRSFGHRAGVWVLAVAAHDILAKRLYASPVDLLPDARAGAMVMYYGGDAVEVVVLVLLCARWFPHRARPAPAALRGAGLPG